MLKILPYVAPFVPPIFIFRIGVSLRIARPNSPLPRRLVSASVAFALLAFSAPAWAMTSSTATDRSPVCFTANQGQVAGPACYYARDARGAAYFESRSVLLDQRAAGDARGVAVRIEFPNATSALDLEAEAPQPGRVSSFSGRDASAWQSGAPAYREVRYSGIAPGADLVYHVEKGRLKYDVVLAPGASVSDVRLRYRGVERLEIEPGGGLTLHTAAGALHEEAPVIYQERQGVRVSVEGGYRLLPGRELGYWVGQYDASIPLVVDPGMVWSTFAGGAGADYAYAVTTDPDGNIYVAGSSASADYPVTAGAYRTAKAAGSDVIVTKLAPDGATVLWSTFLGGLSTETAQGIALDADRNVYVTGNTSSTDFPVTAGALRSVYGGGHSDGFVSKLSASGGTLLYSTLLGGVGDDVPMSIVVDGSGDAVVGGFTGSSDFPTTPGVVKTSFTPNFYDGADGFICKLNATGTGLVYSTFLGVTGGTDEVLALTLDSSGRPTVAGMTLSTGFPTTAGAYCRTFAGGYDAFVTKLNIDCTGYVFSTLLGGTGNDQPWGIAVDGSGYIWVTGKTASTNFPTTANGAQRTYGGGLQDAFLSCISPNGDSLSYSTYMGGSGTDVGYGVTAVPGHGAIVVGSTDSNVSPLFPSTPDAYDGSANGGTDAFVTMVRFGTTPFVYSSLLGSPGNDVARGVTLQPSGHVVVVGYSDNANYPTTLGAFDCTQNSAGIADCFSTVLDIGITMPVAADAGSLHAGIFELDYPFPNPFLSRVATHFALAREGAARLRVYDASGRLIRSLVDGTLSAGPHGAAWDGRDGEGRWVAAGVYHLELSAGGQRLTRSVTLLK